MSIAAGAQNLAKGTTTDPGVTRALENDNFHSFLLFREAYDLVHKDPPPFFKALLFLMIFYFGEARLLYGVKVYVRTALLDL